MSITQQAESPDTPHANDELLTMKEVAKVVRVPVATLRYWRHLGSGPRDPSVSVKCSAIGAPKFCTGSNSRATILRHRLRLTSASRWKAGGPGQHRDTQRPKGGRHGVRTTGHHRASSATRPSTGKPKPSGSSRASKTYPSTGSFVDSVLARITVGDWATHWLDNQTHLKPSTHEAYAGIIREHIRPKWDRVKLANVSTPTCKEAEQRCRRPAHPRRSGTPVLSLILNMAVKDGRLARNVATGVNSRARPRSSAS